MRAFVCALVVAACFFAVADAQTHYKKAVLPGRGKAKASESSHASASAGADFVVHGKTGAQVLATLKLVVPKAVQHLAKLGPKAKTASAEYIGNHHFLTAPGLIQKANVKISPKAQAVISVAQKLPSAAELAAIVAFVNGKKAGAFLEVDQAPRKPKGATRPRQRSEAASSESSHSAQPRVFVIVVAGSHHSSSKGKFLEVAAAVAQAPRKPKGASRPSAKPHASEASAGANAWKRVAGTKDIKGLKHPNLFIVDQHFNVLAAPPSAQLNAKL